MPLLVSTNGKYTKIPPVVPKYHYAMLTAVENPNLIGIRSLSCATGGGTLSVVNGSEGPAISQKYTHLCVRRKNGDHVAGWKTRISTGAYYVLGTVLDDAGYSYFIAATDTGTLISTKYDQAGVCAWSVSYTISIASSGRHCVLPAGDGIAVVFTDAAFILNILLLSKNEGSIVWQYRSTTRASTGANCAVSDSGELLVLVEEVAATGIPTLLRFDELGNTISQQRYADLSAFNAVAACADRIFIAAYASNLGKIVAFDRDGLTCLWSVSCPYVVQQLAADAYGNTYLAMYGTNEVYLAKLDIGGGLVWQVRIGGVYAGTRLRSYRLGVDSDGDPYLLCTSNGYATGISLKADGSILRPAGGQLPISTTNFTFAYSTGSTIAYSAIGFTPLSVTPAPRSTIDTPHARYGVVLI